MRQTTKQAIKDAWGLLVQIWIKDLPITLVLFLLVFSLWIPPIVYEAVTASLLSLAVAPEIKKKIFHFEVTKCFLNCLRINLYFMF